MTPSATDPAAAASTATSDGERPPRPPPSDPAAPPTTTTTSSPRRPAVRGPEFVAVILAATTGARLFPLTSSPDDDHDDDGFGDDGIGDGFGREEGSEDSADDAVRRGEAAAAEDDDDDDDGPNTTKDEARPRPAPKHLLPVAGHPILLRLLRTVCHGSRFQRCVVALSHDDDVTIPALLSHDDCVGEVGGRGGRATMGKTDIAFEKLPEGCRGSADALRHLSRLRPASAGPDEGGGGIGPVAEEEEDPAIPADSTAIVLPGDLILESFDSGRDVLGTLADAHRRGHGEEGLLPVDRGRRRVGDAAGGAAAAGVTMLLSDVGEEDENGVPLKESAKQKKGGLGRDEEDIEYIGLSSFPSSSPADDRPERYRIVLKQSKIAVEEDEGVGSTPKLSVPKRRLRSPGTFRISIRTDLSDLHVYAISPWVLQLLQARTGLVSIQGDLLPLLISRQFRGLRAAFGSEALAVPENREILEEVLSTALFGRVYGGGGGSGGAGGGGSGGMGYGDDGEENGGGGGSSSSPGGCAAAPRRDGSFAVAAQVLPRTPAASPDEGRPLALRACTVPSYLYGCRESVSRAVHRRRSPPSSLRGDAVTASSGRSAKAGKGGTKSAPPPPYLPPDTVVQSKFNSIQLPGSTVGDKVKHQSCTVGRNARLGGRCRLNNVVIMDGVRVGENCVLQNSVLGTGCTIGENCNLKDCQVGPGADVPSFTKENGESFL